MADLNFQLLVNATRLLLPVLDELVFVGGSITGLLITDKGASDVRPTDDVDAITEITTYAEYTALASRLRRLGFSADTSKGAPTCRFRNGSTKLDVMPLNENILGFSNRWYQAAIETAQERELGKGLVIRIVTAPLFCATKLEAFRGRGSGDYFASHDLEDLVSVIDGRPELLDELQSAPDDVRSYIAKAVGRLLSNEQFINALPGHLPLDAMSQSRIGPLLETLNSIASLS